MLYPQSNGIRQTHDLGGFWDFRVDPHNVGEADGWIKGFEGAKMAVPASFNEQLQYQTFDGVDLMHYLGTVWYCRQFFVPAGMNSGRVFLRFGAVYYSAKVWLDGRLLGQYSGGFLPFEFDITDAVRSGETHNLVVQVNNETGLSDIPQYRPEEDINRKWPTYIDWFPYSGIHRPVVIYSTGCSHIDDISVKPSIEGKCGVITYDVSICGSLPEEIVVTLRRGDFEVKQKHSRPSQCTSGVVQVENADLWTPESPNLYEFRVELTENGHTVDRHILNVGIRTIKVDGDKLLLNGESIFLRGICRHEDFAITGRTVDRAVMNRDMSLIKWVGANSIRGTHYPYSEEFLDLADQEGMLLFEEVPAWCLMGDFLSDDLLATHKQMIADLIKRDKNHPSVIGWYVANEPYFGDGTSIDTVPSERELEYFRELCRFTKALDDRPITIAGCTRTDEHILQFCDIASVNRYYGWYHYPGRLDLATEKLSENLDDLYNKVKKPVIIGEFGGDAITGVHSDPPAMYTEEYQSELYKKTIPLLEGKPYIVGAMIWVYADFMTYQSPMRPLFNRKGIFTRERQPKMAAHTVKGLWNGEKRGSGDE